MIFGKSKTKQRQDIGEFAHKNKDLLVIVADPKDDSIFVSYNDKHAGGRVKSMKGDKSNIVRDVLRSATFERTIGDFLVSLGESIGIKKLKHANNFLHVIDGALYNIAMKSRNKKKNLQGPPAKGAIKSPLSADSLGRGEGLKV